MAGFLLFILSILVILALLVLGAIMFRRAQWWMTKTIAWITIVIAAVMVISFVVGGLLTSRLIFSLVFFELLSGIALVALIFWVAMLADCALNENPQNEERLIWVLIIIFTQIIGALIYFFARRPHRISGKASAP